MNSAWSCPCPSSDPTQGPHSNQKFEKPDSNISKAFPLIFPSHRWFPEEYPACYPCFLWQELLPQLWSTRGLLLMDSPLLLEHPDPQEVPQGVTPAWPGMESLDPAVRGSSQSAVPPPPRARALGDKVPFKILLLFPFISLGWVSEGFSGTGHGQSTSLGWSRFSWNSGTQ